jgi:trans-2,3-dihydro-3-hydroxyanthranilate isomerase
VRPYLILDVFTDRPLEGNPLAVFPDADGLDAQLMQRIARELNLSETAFIVSADGNDGADARIRIFTPTTELPFAGHPTLGSAFAVAERDGKSDLRLHTGAGVVPVRLERDAGRVVYGEMEQPIPAREKWEREHELLAALGIARSELPVEAYRNGPAHVYVTLASPEDVARLSPDLRALQALGEYGVACVAGSAGSWKSRNFAPGLGVPEDPATGSAAGPLALHLARNGRIAFGQEIRITQGVEIERPSTLFARVEGSDDRVERVLVGGSAVVVARGQYRLE